MKKRKFLGVDCVEAKFGDIELWLANSIGPRIISLAYKKYGNIFAELPDEVLECPRGGKFRFYGGHRLWVAPEVPSVTYMPDDHPITINWQSDGIEMIQAPDSNGGLLKTIYIRQTDYANIIIIDHLVKNKGDTERKIAPWAITQMKVGGTAILPYKSSVSVKSPLLPNRSLYLWPYTNIHDPRIQFNKHFIFVSTVPLDESPLKVGIAHMQKWIAYFMNGLLFIKYSNKIGPDCALDMGAAGQCYCNDKFIELETLGVYRKIEPSESISHREVWRIVENPFSSPTTEALQDFIEKDEMADICREML